MMVIMGMEGCRVGGLVLTDLSIRFMTLDIFVQDLEMSPHE